MFHSKITEDVKSLIKDYIKAGDTCADLTVGNGHDTLFMADLVGATGKIYGFDIQEKAIELTKQLVREAGFEHVLLLNVSHEYIGDYIHEPLSLVMMNLGYLPGGDKTIVTKKDSTLKAIKESLILLKATGVIGIVSYIGHEGSYEEYHGLVEYMKNLDSRFYSVRKISYVNRGNNPPIIYLICKNKSENSI